MSGSQGKHLYLQSHLVIKLFKLSCTVLGFITAFSNKIDIGSPSFFSFTHLNPTYPLSPNNLLLTCVLFLPPLLSLVFLSSCHLPSFIPYACTYPHLYAYIINSTSQNLQMRFCLYESEMPCLILYFQDPSILCKFYDSIFPYS